jgi:hypothetical protein
MVKRLPLLAIAAACAAAFVVACAQVGPGASKSTLDAPPRGPGPAPVDDALMHQSKADADAKSKGCVTCHQGIEPSHEGKQNVAVGCVDCHGGDADATEKNAAHVASADPKLDGSRATDWLRQTAEYVRFVNPGDLRVVATTCGRCHPNEAYNSAKSMMATGAMLWGAALYNNGSFPLKRPRFGEAYDESGAPVRLQTYPPPSDEDVHRGVLAYLDPLPRYNVTQMGNILRVFERGGKKPLELGNPDKDEESGLPARRLSQRGLGTLLRTDPVYLGLTKTRLLDPILWMPGTNDHPGDYRGSGCTACHMIYANDRDPVHSGSYAQFGNRGRSKSADKTIDKKQDGHPIRHELTKKIPSSQCIVCHMHPGTNMVTTYYGDLWYDNETDASALYDGADKSMAARHEIQQHNPESAALRGKWSGLDFLADVTSLNPQMKNVQLEDYHGHGWLYRKVWKKDRKGNLLDADDKVVAADDPKKFEKGKAVHLMDIHAERGMHCVDCHFAQDVHGDGKLYGEPRAAMEITCVDCHGTIDAPTTLNTSGAAAGAGRDLAESTTPFGKRFFRRGGIVYQRSQLERDVVWAVPQIADAINPANAGKKYGDGVRERPVYNERARYAKTIGKDNATWGAVPKDGNHANLAHDSNRMTCQACHTSWTTACFGCHLPMQANARKEIRHFEGGTSRNWTSYNYQVLRDDAYMLGIDGSVTGNKVSPVRSACAVVVASQNQNREWLYSQQQTISAEGFAGTAFSTYVPHTVRGRETKGCSDCHLSEKNDNNAWMAQLLLHGTNYVNFMGRYVYVGCGEEGFQAVAVTEREEPQAVFGSTLQRDAFPERFKKFVDGGRKLAEAYHHHGEDTRSVQLRGEYLYAANGRGGLEVYDVANIDDKGVSERITTSLNSPLGQRLYVKTPDATCVASPTTLGVDPTRPRREENEEQPIDLMYAFLYVTDREQGLVMVNAATLLDGNPSNNFLDKHYAFNPDHVLDGAETITIAGKWAYVGCKAGLVILDLSNLALDNPTPRVAKVIGNLVGVTSVAVQFRYAFVTTTGYWDMRSHPSSSTEPGLHVLDVTNPEDAQLVPGSAIALDEAHDVYVARTYAFVSAGAAGLVIVDVENPEKPVVDQTFTADGAMNDVRCCRVAMTNASLFAYVADGKNGLRVLQLTSPETVPQFGGFSPRAKPALIATYATHGPALTISKPLDRDRAVDESGDQLAVFGRVGARPFNLEEQRRLYMRDGKLFRVSDGPKTRPVDGK